MKAVFYQSIGPELIRHDIDVDAASLVPRDAVTTPGANVQYVWPHPSKQWLYVVSSDGGPNIIPGTRHIATAFRIDPSSGALSPHGEPVSLPSRPVHCSVDCSGGYLLTAYNYPSNITVHRIGPDGAIGDLVPHGALDVGVFAHQVLTTPGNQTAIMVTRGNNPEAGKAEDPGALKVYGFKDGVLSNLASIQRGNGLGFGPRHFEVLPEKPWLFLSVERQSELHVYSLNEDGTLPRDATFIKNALIDRANHMHTQMAGAIHIHPNGRFVYMTNRNSGTEEIGGRKVFKAGENNVAVFSIDPASGEPTLIQNIDAHTNHLRTFAIEPSGRLLIAASIQPMAMRDGSTLPAALVLYRIGDDGRLEFARKYDVDTGRFMQFWTGIVTLP
ncbi:MAG: beta-propeller fold lactonase family protein [Hyphomicrobiales bacterium]